MNNALLIEDEKIINTKSLYDPSEEARAVFSLVKKDYQLGYDILHNAYREFNDMNVLDRQAEDMKNFNSYVEPKSDDPDEEWRSDTKRPLIRPKLISIAAHITARLLFPKVFAQNENDDEDKLGSSIMRSLIEFHIQNSDYEMNFLMVVIQGLVNPGMCLNVKFSEILQDVKERQENGEITIKQAIDEVLSGLKTHIVPIDEIMFTNAYGGINIQKQRAIMRQRNIEYDEAKALYGEHKDFGFVRPGIKLIFNEIDGSFYESFDEENPNLVHEVTYYNRRKDMELTFCGGVLVSDHDQPIKHRRLAKDTKGQTILVPIYPFAWSGYELIDEGRFVYFKSAAAKMWHDQKTLDKIWRMVMDGTFLQVMPPIISFGGARIDQSIVFPARVTNFENTDAKIDSPIRGANIAAGWNAISALEKSIAENSQDTLQQGVQGGGGRTAYEISRLEENAKVQLGLFGKMIGYLVKQVGELMCDLIILHQTVGEVEQIVAGVPRMKFRSFLVPNQVEDGKRVKKKIEFRGELIGSTMSKKEAMKKSFYLLEKEGGLDSDTRIAMVNPPKFRQLKYSFIITPDVLAPRSEAFEKMLKLEGYDRMIQNPVAKVRAVSRDYLFGVFSPDDPDKYMEEKQVTMPGQEAGRAGSPLEALAQKALSGKKAIMEQMPAMA